MRSPFLKSAVDTTHWRSTLSVVSRARSAASSCGARLGVVGIPSQDTCQAPGAASSGQPCSRHSVPKRQGDERLVAQHPRQARRPRPGYRHRRRSNDSSAVDSRSRDRGATAFSRCSTAASSRPAPAVDLGGQNR